MNEEYTYEKYLASFNKLEEKEKHKEEMQDLYYQMHLDKKEEDADEGE